MDGSNKPQRARSKGRRNVVGSSPHREDYVRLMRAGWSSSSLERYAAFRYGEDIPERTFRLYRARLKIEKSTDPLEEFLPEATLDVISERASLIRLQKRRIAVDVDLEIGQSRGMNKLLSSTRHEIQLLAELLSQHKTDLQDVGLMPKAGERIEFSTEQKQQGQEVPRFQTLAEALGADEEMAAEVAKVLHMGDKRSENGRAAG